MSIANRIECVVENRAPLMGYAVIIAMLSFLWLPMLVIVYMSFSADGVLTFPPTEYTLDHYRAFTQNDLAIQSILTTLQVSLVATPVAVGLSVMLGYGIDRYSFRGRSTVSLLVSLPIIVPLVVVGAAMAIFFSITNIGSGFIAVTISHIIRVLPFAALIIIPTIMQFDESLEEASMDLGAGRVETFRKVTLPNILPGIIAGALLAFTVSFNEVIYTYFVRGTGMQTLPTYLYSQIRFSASPEINVISVVFLAVATGLMLLAILLTRLERVVNI